MTRNRGTFRFLPRTRSMEIDNLRAYPRGTRGGTRGQTGRSPFPSIRAFRKLLVPPRPASKPGRIPLYNLTALNRSRHTMCGPEIVTTSTYFLAPL